MVRDQLSAAEKIKALLDGKTTVPLFAEQLKHSQDLEADVADLLAVIERIAGWQEHLALSSLYELLKMVEQEHLQHVLVEGPLSDNLYPFIAFANMFVGKNDARAEKLLEHARSLAPENPFALASLGVLQLQKRMPKRRMHFF